MPKVRSISILAEKYASVTPGRQPQYEAGVQAPKNDYATMTLAANQAYKEGVQDAITRDAFAKGVAAVGTAGWKAGAVEKGVQRYGQGVRIGGPKWAKNFAPYREVIERTELPPSYAKGDPRNIERVAVMAKALRDAKIAGVGR